MEVPPFLKSMMEARAALEAKKNPVVGAAKTGVEAETSDRGQGGSSRVVKGAASVADPSAEAGSGSLNPPPKARQKSHAVKRE